jgi:hypothetical protein
MKRSMMLLAAGLLALAACDKPATPETKTDDPNAKHTETTGATTTVATTPPAPPAIADSDLATPADFEEAAEKAISKTNYKAELAAIEADIAKQ